MVKYKTIYFILIVANLVLFTGCGGSAPHPVKKAPIPKWVYAPPPNDTSIMMYGIGIGKNRNSAITFALNDIISRLSITIQSSYQSKKYTHNAYSDSILKENIYANVESIKINNYKIIKSYKLNYKQFAVLIGVDKQKFIVGLKEDFKRRISTLKDKDTTLAQKNIILQYNLTKQMNKEAIKLFSLQLIIKNLDPTYDDKRDNLFLQQIQKEYTNTKSHLRFYVYGDKNAKLFVKSLKDKLSKNGFNVSKTKKHTVEVHVTTKHDVKRNGINLLVITINISVLDRQHYIGGRSEVLKERYNDSLSNVYERAAIHFTLENEPLKINELLGIKLDDSH